MTLYEQDFRTMHCRMYAAIESDQLDAAAALADVPGWFAAWECRFSRFKSDSELSQVNRSADAWTPLSPEFWEVLRLALRAARDSGGLVLPTLLAPLRAAGYDRSFDLMAADGEAAAVRTGAAALDAVELDEHRRAIRLNGGVMLDLGGVVKGWCADTVARRLAHLGAVIVDAGGDIAIAGNLGADTRMLVGVANPFRSEQHIATLALGAGGVATSGRDYRRWRRDGAPQHHIIDPRTGAPADTDVLRATVIAPDAVAAETAAKCALILGSAAGLAWIDARPELAGQLILDDGSIHPSQRWHTFETQFDRA